MNVRKTVVGLIALIVAASALRAGLAPAAGLAAGDPSTRAAVIVGRVWLDLCRPAVGNCIPLSDGNARGDGRAQSGEPGLGAITVTLTARCEGAPVAQTTTNASGVFAFEGLEPGLYCVTVDPRGLGNESLAAGRWTAPLSARMGAPASRIVVAVAGRPVTDVVFGRDPDWIWPTQ